MLRRNPAIGFYRLRRTYSSADDAKGKTLQNFQNPNVAPDLQAPNRCTTWSQRQQPRTQAMKGPRFVGVDMAAQPRPLSAIELLKEHPVVLTNSRTIACDGGGLLGHPMVFINLDNDVTCVPCGYCGQRFQKKPNTH